jgi:hypothetical protein
VLWDNRSGTWTSDGVTGIGLGGAADLELWGLGTADGSGNVSPRSSVLGDTHAGANLDGTDVVADPSFVAPVETRIQVFPWRTYPRFRPAAIVVVDAHSGLPGDHHLGAGSPAIDQGAATISLNPPGSGSLAAPPDDIDGGERPVGSGFDAGADERSGPAAAGPQSPVLDSFNRANGALGPNWKGNTALSRIRILSNRAQVRADGSQLWVPSSFGPAQEARITVVTLPSYFSATGVLLRVTGETAAGALGTASSYVEVTYAPYLNVVLVRTKNAGSNALTVRATFPATLVPGRQLIARIDAGGRLRVLVQPPLGAAVTVGRVDLSAGLRPWAQAQGSGGIGLRTLLVPVTALLDDFGGGGGL